jgi:peptidoglycan hydrolase-like protein with peptidoglycan-binding domain
VQFAGLGILVLTFATIALFLITSRTDDSRSGVSVSLRDVAVASGTLTEKVQAAGTVQGKALEVQATAEQSGIVTWMPSAGTVVSRGQPIFRLDNQPVVLLYGMIPVWRGFASGMSPGPDIAQLETNLLSLGYGQSVGLKTDGTYTAADARAITAFTQSVGLVASSQLGFGTILFEPGPIVITGHSVVLGSRVGAGTQVVQVASTTPEVVAELSAAQAADIAVNTPATFLIGTTKSVNLNGRVSSISPSAQGNPAGSGASSSANGSSQNIQVTIEITDAPPDLPLRSQPVLIQFQTKVVPSAYIVPITALIALVGGGYALQVDDGNGKSHLLAVTVGAIDETDGVAQVTGVGVRQGLMVKAPM